MYCIETENLCHTFKNADVALTNIDLRVPSGGIYGFLGPNGAGKTTTIRLLLSLLKRQQGSIRIFEKEVRQARREVLRKIGCLIESPAFYAHLTATENLEVTRKVYQVPKSRISHVLALAGLSQTGTKTAGRFSLGMKQRLGIASALLHEPKLLILDEPTNGLDPNGIIEIRELLRSLNRDLGITIFISSHLLSEIEKLVSDVGIISNGKLVFQGMLDELLNSASAKTSFEFDVDRPLECSQVLYQNAVQHTLTGSTLIVPSISKEQAATIVGLICQNSFSIYGLKNKTTDLESLFMNLIRK